MKLNHAYIHAGTLLLSFYREIAQSEIETIKYLQEISAMIVQSKIAPIKFQCVKFAGINMS